MKMLRTIGRWPIMGRAIRIVVGLYRLPEVMDMTTAVMQLKAPVAGMQANLIQLRQAQLVLETQHLPDIRKHTVTGGRVQAVEARLEEFQQRLDDFQHRLHSYEVQHLPGLLQTLSELNQRQIATDHGRENLARSVPVALREINSRLKQAERNRGSQA